MHIIKSYITSRQIKKIFINKLLELNVKEPREWPLVSDRVINLVKDEVSSAEHYYALPHKVYIIDAEYDCIQIIDSENDDTEYVYIKDNDGNCVDKFIRHKLNANIQAINYMHGVLCNNALSRKEHLHDYHNSDAFEKDLTMLFGIKEKTEQINKAITKFLENITLCDYVS